MALLGWRKNVAAVASFEHRARSGASSFAPTSLEREPYEERVVLRGPRRRGLHDLWLPLLEKLDHEDGPRVVSKLGASR